MPYISASTRQVVNAKIGLLDAVATPGEDVELALAEEDHRLSTHRSSGKMIYKEGCLS